MNCKPGDLALVVFPTNQENMNLLVHVRAIKDWQEVEAKCFDIVDWEIESLGRPIVHKTSYGLVMKSRTWYAKDFSLRPLRGEDGDDETLAWAGTPHEVKT
jgi:hypothetical protein